MSQPTENNQAAPIGPDLYPELDEPWHAVAGKHFPGLAFAFLIAAISLFVSGQYGGPVMLYALLVGMVFSYLSEDGRWLPGIAFAGRSVLRLGVALLGSQIMLSDFLALGPMPIFLVVSGVAFTILAGTLIGRIVGLDLACSILSAGAVAICGASAALAISAVLPMKGNKEGQTLLIIVGVTALSTVAMVLYPVIASALGFSLQETGLFIGATIHDVAQVVGAGYMVSPETGDTATMVKLMRVACLAPVVMIIGLTFRKETGDLTGKSPPILPPFLIWFCVLVAVNSLNLLPSGIRDLTGDVSRWCLIAAVAAIGAKMSPKEMLAPGPRPLAALSVQTVALAGFAIVVIFSTRMMV